MADPIHAGGCLCGAVRYEVRGPALQTTLCHCEDCRRASGAPVVAWTFFRGGALEWTRGEPASIGHADRVRWFCAGCGTPLLFVDPSLPGFTEVNTCSLDEPGRFAPADECWLADRLGWMELRSGLPGYEHTAPLPEE